MEKREITSMDLERRRVVSLNN